MTKTEGNIYAFLCQVQLSIRDLQVNQHFRIFYEKPGDAFSRFKQRECQRCRNTQFTTGLGNDAVDQYVGLIHGVDNALAAGEKLLPLRGERDPPGCSMQDLKPDPL